MNTGLHAEARPRAERGLGAGFRRTWAASAVSAVGTGMHFAAFPVLAAEVTSDPGQLSLVTVLGSLPWLLVALPAGVLVDRMHPGRIMVAADFGRAVAVVALLAMLWAGGPNLPALLVVSALLGVGEVFFECAAQSFLPAVVAKEDLEQANGRLFTGVTAGRDFVGQLVGGTLFAVSRTLPFVVNLVSFVASGLLIAGVRTTEAPPKRAAKGAMLPQIAAGLRLILRNRVLRSFALASAVVNAVFLGELAVLVLFATRELGLAERYYGLLLTAMAVGGVGGGLLAPQLVRRLDRRAALTGALVAIGASSLVLGLAAELFSALAAFVLMGFAMTLWNVVVVSLRQMIVPAEFLGRTNSVYRLLGWGAMPLGGLLAGAAADAWGLRTPFALGGAATVLCALAVARVLRRETLPTDARETDGRATAAPETDIRES
ncbi:MFS transporter [Kitasatospora xanthocidica]|uniref:MFS transporter n=1 Tax=Kitasatospora xanthocidica TaxID=83382 RepID=A0A372ZI58_9ACTN|nr:MFS transporter [Kitasatospora xanthocidica]RGD55441.1 MFS transporter [Kitasatospora xanthocidica]